MQRINPSVILNNQIFLSNKVIDNETKCSSTFYAYDFRTLILSHTQSSKNLLYIANNDEVSTDAIFVPCLVNELNSFTENIEDEFLILVLCVTNQCYHCLLFAKNTIGLFRCLYKDFKKLKVERYKILLKSLRTQRKKLNFNADLGFMVPGTIFSYSNTRHRKNNNLEELKYFLSLACANSSPDNVTVVDPIPNAILRLSKRRIRIPVKIPVKGNKEIISVSGQGLNEGKYIIMVKKC